MLPNSVLELIAQERLQTAVNTLVLKYGYTPEEAINAVWDAI